MTAHTGRRKLTEAQPKSENEELLTLFAEHCRAHPTERFWQALRNWSGQNFILASKIPGEDFEDTFYWRGKTQ